MLYDPRIRLSELSAFCRRLANSLEAGIDLKRVLGREAQRSLSPQLAAQVAQIRAELASGNTLTQAVESTGRFFPEQFCDLVAVGEETGQLPEVLHQLADHYDHLMQLRRTFLASITWPAIQLGAAIGIIGLLIWVMGIIGSMPGREPIDILGLGLVGTSGLAVYCGFWLFVAAGAWFAWQSVRRGALWTTPLQVAVLRVPALGSSLRTLALARMAWSLQLTLNTGMSLKRALQLALASTQNATFTRHTEQVTSAVARGDEIGEALEQTGDFPRDFLDTLEVGERSGKLPESLAILARQYQQKAQQALATLTVVAGFGVWGMVAVLIIVMIFRIFSFYLGAIQDALP